MVMKGAGPWMEEERKKGPGRGSRAAFLLLDSPLLEGYFRVYSLEGFPSSGKNEPRHRTREPWQPGACCLVRNILHLRRRIYSRQSLGARDAKLVGDLHPEWESHASDMHPIELDSDACMRPCAGGTM